MRLLLSILISAILYFSSLSSAQSTSTAPSSPAGVKAAAADLGSFGSVMGSRPLGGVPFPMILFGGSTTFSSGASLVRQQRLGFSAPIFSDGRDSYGFNFAESSVQFGQSPILSDSGTVLPENFYRIDLGASFHRRLEEGRLVGAQFSVGTASDKPFTGSKDLTYSFMGFYSLQGTETSHWVLTVFTSNNNPILNYIPIPGFIYFYRAPGFVGMFGLPFASMIWTPFSPYAFSLSLFGPSINSEAIYGEKQEWLKFFTFSWSQNSFLRHDRTDIKDRVFLNEKRVGLGVRTPASEKLSGEFQLGQAFDRSVYEGSRFNQKDGGSMGLDSSAYAQANVRWVW